MKTLFLLLALFLTPDPSRAAGATEGFFSLEQKDGVWWVKSPAGERMFYTAVQCVGPLDWKNKKDEGFAERTEKRLKQWGFRGVGAWNGWTWRDRQVPFTESLGIWSGMKSEYGLKPVYDTDWDAQALERVTKRVARLKDLHHLVGYFLDNEIHWDEQCLFHYFEGRKAGDPNRQAVIAFLRKRHGTIQSLNQAWGTHLDSFGALARLEKLPVGLDASRKDRLAFLGQVAARYFRTASTLVRQADPHHLILGSRHAGMPAWEVFAAQAGATDAVSINIYRPEGRLDEAGLARIHEISGGQPVWITEFSFHSPFDNRSGNTNKIGFGARVREQKNRGKGYQTLVSHAASLPFMVGTDWFQYYDEPPGGREGDGEDVNFGLIDRSDRPYEALVAAVEKTNRAVDAVHAASGSWKPAPPAPEPLRLDLAPSGAALKDLKFRPGMDSMPARPPVKARLSWKPAGLTVEVDVACKRRTTETKKVRDSIEWFWMTDAVEILLRPDGPMPEALDDTSLKIWAVPDGLGQGTPYVGSWRRHERVEGIPAGATVVQRPLRGGYGITFTIPPALIQAGDFGPGQTLRFNLLVEDCREVMEVYWNGHQGEGTTEKPATWGALHLVGEP